MNRTPAARLVPWLLVAYAAWYLLLSVVLPIPWIVNGLLDDSFYYLQVARNVARGLGSTFDGVEPTNGYHPLWMLLLVPVERLAASRPDLSLRLALLLSALLGLGSLLLIRRLLARAAGAWAAAAGLLLFAWPRFFGQTVTLLETGLLLFLLLAVAAIVADPGAATRMRKFALGVAIGLAALARLDAVFLLLAAAFFGAFLAFRRLSLSGDSADPGIGLAGRLWSNLWFLGVAALLVIPYLLWNDATFGHLQPVSGAVKSTFPHAHPHPEYLRQFPEFTLLLALGCALFVLSLRSSSSQWIRMLGLFGLAGLLHLTYTILFMGWGVDRWYFALTIPEGVLGIPWLLARAIERIPAGARERAGPAALAAGLLLAVGVQAVSLRAREGRHLAAAREFALWSRERLPEDAVFAMTDAGVFAYYSGRTTINLDGLINNYRYQEVLRSGRVLDYLAERRVGFIFDQAAYGHPDLLNGTYEARPIRFWYRPENRVVGRITLRRSDEVRRVNLLSRPAALKGSEPNALILYRYHPEVQNALETVVPSSRGGG